MWFLRPKHTLESVARRILEGLEDGTIVLDASAQPILPDVQLHTPAGSAALEDQLLSRSFQSDLMVLVTHGVSYDAVCGNRIGTEIPATSPEVVWLPTASLSEGPFRSYVGAPATSQFTPHLKRDSRADIRHIWSLVAPAGPTEEMPGDALMH